MEKTYIMRKHAACLLILCLIGILTACNGVNKPGSEVAGTETTQEIASTEAARNLEILNKHIFHRDDSAGVHIQIPTDDFSALGFAYGDSVDLVFSNGYKLEDVPYYNGYYVDAYQPLLVGYPGRKAIKAGINYGDDLWITAGVTMKDTCSIYLREKGKYKAVQDAMDIHYSDDRQDFSSDEVFANFRNVSVGKIGDNILYRSASPCNNKRNRAPYADGLAEKAGIRCILDLADDDKLIAGYMAVEDFNSPYFKELYEKGDVIPAQMAMNYVSEDFKNALSGALTRMTEKEGPYLVHCTEGKDRTGFVCILLEMLCGATYKEIEKDYMITYDNYYGINEESDPERYKTIKEKNIDPMIKEIIGDESVDITTADLSAYAKKYMLRIGMSEQDADTIVSRLNHNSH